MRRPSPTSRIPLAPRFIGIRRGSPLCLCCYSYRVHIGFQRLNRSHACRFCVERTQGPKRRRTSNQDATGVATSGDQNIDPAVRQQTAMQLVMKVMQGKEQSSLGDLLSDVNAVATGKEFTRTELQAVLSALDDDNKIMFYDDMVHKV